MNADGLGNCINRDTVFSMNHRVYAKAKAKNQPKSLRGKDVAKPFTSLEMADQIVEKVSQKLQVMTNVLNQIRNEKDDIIRAQLARFFNVLRVFIDEALHPTGDWTTDQIMSGKTITVNLRDDGASITVQGERIAMASMEICELQKSPTSEDMETMQQSINKTQASITILRNNIASARSQITNHSNKSSVITL